MGAADHDDLVVLGRLRGERVAQPLHRGQQLLVDHLDQGDVHGRGKGVVARLTEVHVVVGMNRRFAAAAGAGQLVGPAGDHLVGVHVAVRARARLKDDQRELVVELAVRHFLRGAGDELGLAGLEPAELLVGPRRGQLEDAERADDRPSPHEAPAADGEVLERPLRLCTPVVLPGHADLAHAVVLDALVLAHTANTTRFVEKPVNG